MNNKETLKQNNSRIDINNTDLASILITINNLPKHENVTLQEKNVTPNTETQEIVADVGYTGLSKVNVGGDIDLLPENIKKGVNIFGVDGEASVADFEINDCSYLFYNSARLNAMDDLLPLCKNVTNMSNMFQGCSSLTELNLSNFDTSNVTDMYYTFSGCNSLTSLDLSNFNTSNVTDMSSMFEKCSSLTSLNLSKFDTNKLGSMRRMFDSCSALTNLDLSGFNTSKINNMQRIFYGCSKLTILDLSNFDTSRATDMSEMFRDCSSLTKLDIRNFTFDRINYSSNIFLNIPTDCLIIVKSDTEKAWVLSKRSDFTNVKTVAEL